MVVGRAGVGNLTDVPHEERHTLVELELVDGLVVGHVQEGLPINFQDLVSDLKRNNISYELM